MTIETWEQVGTLVERDLQNERDRKSVGSGCTALSYNDILAIAGINNTRRTTDPKVFAINPRAKKIILDALKANKR